MEYVIIALAAVLASGLTLFSGFGLGTMLLPVFALFFPVEVAIGMTAVVIASLVDFSRLLVYSSRFDSALQEGYIPLLLVAVVSAFFGAFLGNRLLKKVTMHIVQIIVSVLLVIIALGLILGFV